MKRILPLWCAVLLATASMLYAAVGLTGCVLFSGNATTDQKAADIRNLSYAAASLGAQEALLQNATWRPQFVAAYENLNTLVNGKIVTGSLLRSVLDSLPVKELKSERARIAIEAATVLFDSTAGTKVDLEKSPYALAAAEGIRDGLKVALKL